MIFAALPLLVEETKVTTTLRQSLVGFFRWCKGIKSCDDCISPRIRDEDFSHLFVLNSGERTKQGLRGTI
jgi:hypothetical protein